MTTEEIRAGLRRAAAVCIENNQWKWWRTNVCVATSVFDAAMQFDNQDEFPTSPEHAAMFLRLVAEEVRRPLPDLHQEEALRPRPHRRLKWLRPEPWSLGHP